MSESWSRETLAWLAGLLEGEGSFVLTNNPRCRDVGRPYVTVDMTDEDVIRKCCAIAGMGHVYGPYRRQAPRKEIWSWKVTQQLHAYALMVAIYQWMGERRQASIREVLTVWLNRERKTPASPPGFFR